MIVNPTGGSQKTPEISVKGTGLITATAGNKSATHQLSSADDSNFNPNSILKGRTIFGLTGAASLNCFMRVNEADLTKAGSNYFEFKLFAGDKWSSYGHDLLALCLSVRVSTPSDTFYKYFKLSGWNTNWLTTDKGIDLYWVEREELECSSATRGDYTQLSDTVSVTCTYDDTDPFNTYVIIRVECSDFGTLGLTNGSNYYISGLDGFVMLFEDD